MTTKCGICGSKTTIGNGYAICLHCKKSYHADEQGGPIRSGIWGHDWTVLRQFLAANAENHPMIQPDTADKIYQRRLARARAQWHRPDPVPIVLE